MANTLKFKRGLVAGLPTAALGEPLFTTDTFDLYIGNGTGNTRFQKYIASGATTQILRGDGSLYTFPLAISSPTNGQVLKYNGTSWVNDSDAGITGSGTTNYLPKFTSATTLGNSLAQDTGAGIDIVRAGDVVFGVTATAAGSTSIYLTPNGGGFGQLSTLGSAHLRLGTNGTERARIFATGNFGINTGATDSGQRLQVVGTGYFSDAVGIGSTTLTTYSLRVSKGITGSTISYGIASDGAIQSGVTNKAFLNVTSANTAAANFAINDINHYAAFGQTTFSNVTAGGSVANQFGFFVDSSLTGATTNYAFYSAIASGTGRWNLYMAGTANNYIAGSLGIGTTTLIGFNLRIDKNITGAAASYGAAIVSNVQSTVTNARVFYSEVGTAAASFTLNELTHFYAVQGTFGAGSVVTNQFGFRVLNNLTGATNNYGFYGDLAAATGRWNLYMNGTALNYMNGALLLGSTTSTSEQLQVTGTAKITGASSFGGDKTMLAGTKIIFNNSLNDSSTFLQNSGTTGNSVLYSNGKISIGLTTVPLGSLLHVQGYMSVQNNLGYCGVSNTGNIVQLIGLNSSNQTIIGTTSSGSVMTLTGNNVGIGITPTERLHVSGNAIVTGNLTVDTNTLFVDAVNNRVGILTTSPSYGLHVNGTGYFNDNIRFPNLKGVVFVQTGGSLLGSISMDSSNNVTIDNNGFFGLSVGTNYNLLGGNTGIGTNTFGTSATRTFAMLNGTAPSTSPVDTFQMYSNDVTAGNAAPHIRTENGAVIKLYQETTSVGNAIISLGGGNAVLDDTTFDGYTLRQIVKALRNQGILA